MERRPFLIPCWIFSSKNSISFGCGFGGAGVLGRRVGKGGGK